MNKKLGSVVVLSTIAILGMSGCASHQTTSTSMIGNTAVGNTVSAVRNSSSATDQRIAELQRQLMQKEAAISSLKMRSGETSLTPPNAKPGECYSKVMVPAKYEIKTVQREAQPASERVSIIPATYKVVDKVVTVREASTKLQTIPPTYKLVKERVLVRPETTKLIPIEPTYKYVKERVMVEPEKVSYVTIPEKYKTVTEKILVKKAHTAWKKGRGSVEKINNTTGGIMCLVEVPAVYKTITKKVLAAPAQIKQVVKPAVYKTITKRVIDRQASTKPVVIPAVYKTITKKVIDRPASTRTINIPAKTAVVKTKVLNTPPRKVVKKIPAVYKTFKVKTKVADSYIKWQEILCETNTTPNVVRKLQRALKAKKYNITKFDGIYGWETKRAVQAYQKDMGMAQGALTLRTLRSLGVM